MQSKDHCEVGTETYKDMVWCPRGSCQEHRLHPPEQGWNKSLFLTQCTRPPGPSTTSQLENFSGFNWQDTTPGLSVNISHSPGSQGSWSRSSTHSPVISWQKLWFSRQLVMAIWDLLLALDIIQINNDVIIFIFKCTTNSMFENCTESKLYNSVFSLNANMQLNQKTRFSIIARLKCCQVSLSRVLTYQ